MAIFDTRPTLCRAGPLFAVFEAVLELEPARKVIGFCRYFATYNQYSAVTKRRSYQEVLSGMKAST
jgi:hypothetical protein